jgi:hypothetical protein
LGLATKFNVSKVAVMASENEIGSNYVQSVQGNAHNYNVDASFAVVYDPKSGSSIEEAFKSIISSGISTIILVIYGVAGDVLSVARRLNMLNGNFWIICTIGFDERLTSFNIPANETDAFSGVWQVERPTPYDVNREGETAIAKEFRTWYRDLYNLDSPTNKGVAIGYNPNMITLFKKSIAKMPSRCKNTTALQVAKTITDVEVDLVRKTYKPCDYL